MRASRTLRLPALAPLLLIAGLLGPTTATAAPAIAAPAAPAGQPVPALAAASSSGSIVYVKDHNVHVARPDGTGARRITSDGTSAKPWRTPSSTDGGLVVAAKGSPVYRMDQWGTILNSFDPPDLLDSAAERIGGTVVHAVVSPNGAHVAYTFQHHTCPPRGACRMRWTTAVSAASRLTSPYQLGLAFYEHPSWVTSSRLVLNGVGYDSIYTFDLGTRQQFWFHDAQASTDFHYLFEPVISRDGALFAAVRGEGSESHIVTSSVNGNILSGPVPTWPTHRCQTLPAVGFASPTFAPDGGALAWQGAGGVWVKKSPLDCGVQPALAIPGARSPHWSAARLQTSRPNYPAPVGRFALITAPVLKKSGAVRVGKRLRVTAARWDPMPSRVRYQWLRDGRPIRKATSARYRVKRADRAHRLSVRVTAQRSGYRAAVATTRKVKVRR